MSIAARNAMLAGGGSQPSGGYWGLCFTAEQANSTVRIGKFGSPSSKTILYSTDAVNWSAYTIGTDIVLENVGDKVWMKAGEGGNSGGWFTSVMACYRFKMTGLIAASGNLMSIVDGETETFTAKVFRSLFQGCTSLTTAPALPATTLATNCYLRMFYNCSSLISAPAVLPAETLVAGTHIDNGCYGHMFHGCTSLTTAPALPATTLASYCYSQMFSGCTSLTATPLLPATSLPTQCYFMMFQGCTSLATVRTAQTQAWGDGTSDDPSHCWLEDVAATGTFYCPTALGTNATITRGVSACPEGWTVINTDA